MKILVVDDEMLLGKGMKFNLENEGYTVETAYDGEAAVELAKNNDFDLIILDLMMPKLDGLSACMKIREFSNVPIIMLTAKSVHDEFVRLDLDLAGRQIGVDRVGRAELHFARHRDDRLEVGLFDKTEEAAGGVDDDLGEAVVVAEVDEKDAAVVTEAEHPAGKPDGLARVRGAELIARVRTIRMHSVISSKTTNIIP